MRTLNNNYIAVIQIPAIATVTGWVRTAKTVYISTKTPPWMVGIMMVGIMTDIVK